MVCEKYITFAKERLLGDSTKQQFDLKKISNIKINRANKKTPNKVIYVLEEDKQAFDIIEEKPTNLNETFSYPVTSLHPQIPVYIKQTKLVLETTSRKGQIQFCVVSHQMPNESIMVWQPWGV